MPDFQNYQVAFKNFLSEEWAKNEICQAFFLSDIVETPTTAE
jgi:hypothetical protein